MGGLVTKDLFGNSLGRRWYWVAPDLVSKCPCGQVIHYGQRACKGHGMWDKRKFNLTTCFLCSRPFTCRKLKRKSDRSVVTSIRPLIHYINDKVVCHRCKSKEWYQDHKEYAKIYNIITRDHQRQLATWRRFRKQGYLVRSRLD